MRSFWTQALTITRRDLVVEGRSRETMAVVVPFAAAAVFVVPFATDALDVRLSMIAYPVYWLVALLFGMQVALRQTAVETPSQRRQLALLGVDPAARFTGRVISGSLLILVVLAVTAPLVFLFYDPEPIARPTGMIGVLVLFAVGLSMLATLAGDVTAGLAIRTSLAPLLVVPVSVPLLLGAAQALESLVRGRTTLPWVLTLVVTDLALAVTGVITARSLEEANT
ncbi:MAG TPA: heme exporter protein CcmB [Acidimicrobiia bacterium]|nr:heme exporter protein CcmB [Acidimicrobiia bacterium]